MVAHAAQKVQDFGLPNARVELGTAEALDEVFPHVQFDHIYVFFGALNTVTDLAQVAGNLRRRLKPGGTMVLTFVNKWYAADMLANLARFRFRRAFKRLHRVWGGYSDTHHLDSRCFSPREIRRAFGRDFRITGRKGYSIVYPAWYQLNWIRRYGQKLCSLLWDTDQVLNLTPAWSLGEYALYCFEAKA
jgi:SAM-dependent methyltransferase